MHEKATLLVVDDERSNLEALANLLGDHYVLRAAMHGKKALEILKKHSVDLILLDIQMPQMDGYETAKYIKEQSVLSHIPIIFLTARSDHDSIVKGFKSGAVDYITKPFNTEELRVRIVNHLNLYRLQQKLKKQVESEVEKRMEAVKEKQEREALLVQQSKMAELGEMLGAIVHQWRQPLHAISLLADSIEDALEFEKELDAVLLKTRDDIKAQVLFMSDIIESFRNFYKPSQEKMIFSVHEAIEEVMAMFSDNYQQHNISIVLTPCSEYKTFGYANEFKQVILNIFNNAKDAIVDSAIQKGVVHCSFEKSDEQVIIRIRDNGGGIPQQLLPQKLFDAYFSTKGKEGTGIGLYLCNTNGN